MDAAVKSECDTILRLNDKVRRRGQAISQERATAEKYESWMGSFVSRLAFMPADETRPNSSRRLQKDVPFSIVRVLVTVSAAMVDWLTLNSSGERRAQQDQ